MTDKNLRRASLDYGPAASITDHASFEQFDLWRRRHGRRLVLMTTKATTSGYRFAFGPEDILMVGRETSGVPPEVAAGVDARIRLPMRAEARSINVALAAAMMVGEAYRQTDAFEELA